MATAKKAPVKTHTPGGLQQDRARVATKQPYELAYEVKIPAVGRPDVKDAAQKAASSRKAIEKALKRT
jgi:hypothetical protein